VTGPGAVRVEATGETVGEAKWAAVRQLEQLVPGLDRDRVEFQVVTEGERGLLGVGYTPAHVIAVAPAPPGQDAEPAGSEAASDAREFVERVAAAIGADVTTFVAEREGTVTVTCSGRDLGLLIGKHGQTIDAIQYLANAVARTAGRENEVVVDAAGYRERRETALHRMADRAAAEALRYDRPVELEPMRAPERKIVHTYLSERGDVETHSEGDEPDRRLVVSPAPAFGEH